MIKSRSLGIDIGSTTIKMVELEKSKEDISCTAYGVIPLPPGMVADGQVLQPRALAKLIREGLATNKIRTKRVVCAVNGSRLLMRRVEMPPLPPQKLKPALRWELERYVPYTADAVEYDLLPLELLPDKTVAFLVTAPKDSVSSLVTALTEARLLVEALEPGPLALLRWALYNQPVEEEPQLILDLGTSSIKVLVAIAGKPEFARTIPVRELSGGGEAWDSVVAEIRRSTDYYFLQRHSVGERPVLKTCLCSGGMAVESALLERLQAGLGVSINVLDGGSLIKSEANLFGVGLGLALGGV